jgi:hypothetical protein
MTPLTIVSMSAEMPRTMAPQAIRPIAKQSRVIWVPFIWWIFFVGSVGVDVKKGESASKESMGIYSPLCGSH